MSRRDVRTASLAIATFAALVATTVTETSHAADCPPGSWFCEDAQAQPPAPGPAPPSAGPNQPLSDDDPPAEKGDESFGEDGEQGEQGEWRPMPEPPPPPGPITHERRVGPPGKGVKRWREKFGLNLRLEGIPIPDGLSDAWGSNEDPGMGGLGASFRWRPIPWFALDVGLDALGGVDYSGNDRFESAVSASGIFYLNPQHRVQAYLIGGIHVSHADVDNDDFRPNLSESGYSDEYSYFGGQAGVGVEFRVSRRIGIGLDGLALLRTRVDDGDFPEYLDPRTGETGDSNVGGLLRGGVTIWF